MIHQLENDVLYVEIKSKGAELCRIKNKDNNIDYLWSGDSKYWSGQSPILFPIVGNVRNDEYRIEDNIFHLVKHGFGRHSEFQLISENKNEAIFQLKYSEDTLKVYPYKFNLQIKYMLKGNSLKVQYIVTNLDDKEIFFSIGGHPAFNCPIVPGETMEDCYFQFEENENADIMTLSQEGYFKRESKAFLKNSNIIPLKTELFKEDALVFHNLKSKTIYIKSKKSTPSVKFDFNGFPYLGLWSKSNGAPFVCIEPWFGHGEYEDFQGDFRHREGTLKLNANDEFSCSFNITIN